MQIHKAGGKLLIDSTFAPPPLQYPFKFGADLVLHSGMLISCACVRSKRLTILLGTKYFGGHSDLLCGVLVVKTREEWDTVRISAVNATYSCLDVL